MNIVKPVVHLRGLEADSTDYIRSLDKVHSHIGSVELMDMVKHCRPEEKLVIPFVRDITAGFIQSILNVERVPTIVVHHEHFWLLNTFLDALGIFYEPSSITIVASRANVNALKFTSDISVMEIKEVEKVDERLQAIIDRLSIMTYDLQTKKQSITPNLY